MPTAQARWKSLLVYLVPAILLYAVIARGLWRTPNSLIGMYANDDGQWAGWNTESILEWGRFMDLSPFNPLSGMGSLFLPNLPWLNPGALMLALPVHADLAYLLSYTVYYFEVVCSIMVLARVLGMPPLQSSLAGQVYALILFPPNNAFFGTITWYSLAPFNAHLVAVANFALALFLVIGRGGRAASAAQLCGIVALVFIGLFSAPLTFLTYAPVYGAVALGFLVCDRSERRIVIWRAAAAAAVTASFLTSGFADYVVATARLSARASDLPPFLAPGWALLTADYWADLLGKFSWCAQETQPFCAERKKMFLIETVAVGGAIYQALRRQGYLKLLARLFLVFIVAIEAYVLLSIGLVLGPLHTFSTPYLVWSSYSFLVLFVGGVVFGVLRWCVERRRALLRHVPLAVVMVAVPVSAWHAWRSRGAVLETRPPVITGSASILGVSALRKAELGAVTNYLIEHAAIRPGLPFRGYVATYLGDPRGHVRDGLPYAQKQRMSWWIYAESRRYLDRHYGSRFQEVDLWQLGIPTLEEYGQWITVPVSRFIHALFSEPGDSLNGVFLRVYALNLDWLASLGVRFLIVDFAISDQRATLRATERSKTGTGAMYLYEIAGVEPAVSAVRAVRVKTFQEALDRFKTDPKTVSVFTDVPEVRSSAAGLELRMERDGFRVTGASDGPALVVLPVQFSHCFEAERPTGARILRANGIQTGIAFEGKLDLTVRFNFGLFGATGCRKEDAADIGRFGI